MKPWHLIGCAGVLLCAGMCSSCAVVVGVVAWSQRDSLVIVPVAKSLEDRVAAWSHGLPRREAVADGYEFVVEQIRAGKLKADSWPATQQAIVIALATQTDSAIASDLSAWSEFRRSLRNELNAMDAAGKLSTDTDYKTTLSQIAKGLRR